MIDFRYHLVSLISVFLALAVGIVLGAGPLQNSLGTALNDQVTSLRQDRNALNSRLEQTATAVNERDEYIEQAAQSFLPGTLNGNTVSIVTLPGAEDDDVEALTTQLEVAGAVVSGEYALTTAWVDQSARSFRTTRSEQVRGSLGTVSSTGADAVLGEALGKALTASDGTAITLRRLLTASEGSDTLMTVENEPTQAAGTADMIVVVGRQPDTDASGNASPLPTAGTDPSLWAAELAGTASAAPTVVVGSADADTEVVSVIRSADAAVTTVDSVGQATAAVSTPLALAATAGGAVGHYGFDKGADKVMPPVPG